MTELHGGHRRRMKDRFLTSGLDSFDDVNLLELLLFYAIPRQDTNPIAHALLERFGSLSRVLEADYRDLMKVEGVGQTAAELLHLAAPVARRYMIDCCSVGTILRDTRSCGEYLVPRFFGERNEVVYLLCLDAKCKVLECRRLQEGNVNMAAISIRKIVETALSVNATSAVLAHNHTSGIALPSADDKETTRAVQKALDAVGIRLIDHVIVAGDDFVSLNDDGFFG